jgi:putative transposase
LDICVLSEKDFSHGDFMMDAIPIGGIRMIDGNEADDKIIAVMRGDASFGHWKDLTECPQSIIGILAEQESGMKVFEVCRKHGMSDATFYKWKSKFGGMDVSEAKQLKSLEAENTELKKMVAELSLDNRAIKEALLKKY